MPEPVSIAIGCWVGFNALNAAVRNRSAYSTAAGDVTEQLAIVIQNTESSTMLFGRTAAIIADLKGMAAECANPDWDGNGARALDQDAVHNAEAFLRALPENMPMPELAPEPDGSVSLDWIASRHRLFSVSVGSNNRLAYAWLDGAEKGHAVAVFDGQSLPAKVRDGVESIVGNINAALRFA